MLRGVWRGGGVLTVSKIVKSVPQLHLVLLWGNAALLACLPILIFLFTKAVSMTSPSSASSFLGLSYGWSYTLAAFTLTICGCLPLALLLTMHVGTSGAERAHALMAMIPTMAGAIAVVCALLYFTVLRQRTQWRRHALMGMWALSALGMVGWWKL